MRHAVKRAQAVVVIAASSGGLDPLRKIVSRLRSDFPAGVVVVSHASPSRPTLLPALLSANGPLPAERARAGEAVKAGRILVAQPGRDVRISRGGKIRLTEPLDDTFLRPCADVLFESAAHAFGRRAAGVVLSGRGNDGTLGLAVIHAEGGIAVVQAPEDASFPSMPCSALAVVNADVRVPAGDIAAALDRLLRDRLTEPRTRPRKRRRPHRRTSLRGLNVLVAESRSPLGAELLGKLGCTVVGPVSDAATGLRILDQSGTDVDCAVLDVELGGQTVYPLATALRARTIPIVFATDPGVTALPKQWFARTLIEKPFNAKTLASALRLVLRGRKAALPPARNAQTRAKRPRRRPEKRDAAMLSIESSRQAIAASRSMLSEARSALNASGRRTDSNRRSIQTGGVSRAADSSPARPGRPAGP